MWMFFVGNSCLVASRAAAKLLYCSLNWSQTGTRWESTSIWKRHIISQHFSKPRHLLSPKLAQQRKVISKSPGTTLDCSLTGQVQASVVWFSSYTTSCLCLKASWLSNTWMTFLLVNEFFCTTSTMPWSIPVSLLLQLNGTTNTAGKTLLSGTLTAAHKVLTRRQKPCFIFVAPVCSRQTQASAWKLIVPEVPPFNLTQISDKTLKALASTCYQELHWTLARSELLLSHRVNRGCSLLTLSQHRTFQTLALQIALAAGVLLLPLAQQLWLLAHPQGQRPWPRLLESVTCHNGRQAFLFRWVKLYNWSREIFSG